MYAVIQTGGKQYKVEKGDVIEVERLDGDEITFTPVLLVNRGNVWATPEDLEGTTVTARVVGDAKGPKITGFTYKSKSNQRRRWGHRQKLSVVEIVDISVGAGKAGAKKSTTADDPAPEPAAAEAAPAASAAETSEEQ